MEWPSETRRPNLWFVWNYELEQQRLDRLSSGGLHLERPGKILNRYVRDPSKRYTYRLDYRPHLRSANERRDYLDLYRDAGWTHIGDCLNWNYFRREWIPGRTPEIYSDRESLQSHYKRIRRVLGAVFVAELPILFINAGNLLVQPAARRALPFSAAVVALLLAAVAALGYGFLMLTRKINKIGKS